MATLKDNLKRLRGTETQEALAARVGVKQPVYSKWERGSAVPKAHHLLRLAVAHGVTVGKLLAGLDSEYDSLDSDLTRHRTSGKTPAAPLSKKAGEPHVARVDDARVLQRKLNAALAYIEKLGHVLRTGRPTDQPHRKTAPASPRRRGHNRGSD